jgi:UDPglucose--hexose-1-phosphate uridylyltransferase
VITGDWIVLATDRAGRPQDFEYAPDPSGNDSCAFCAGREDETPRTLASYPPGLSASPYAWQVRVVENLYPVFVDDPPDTGIQPGWVPEAGALRQPSLGQHEVIIESPAHKRYLTELSLAEAQLVFSVYRDRMQSIASAGRWPYALIFKNSGREAGMSREHLHSQLVALPAVPPVAQSELGGARHFLEAHGKCVFCFMYEQVIQDRSRLVHETDRIIAFCPYASRLPYEVCVMPKRHGARFECVDDGELRETSAIVWEVVRRLEACLGRAAYNFLLHSSPFDTRRQDYYHWHIEILPRTSRLAGLEWGTGVLVNTVSPEAAAHQLRGVEKV